MNQEYISKKRPLIISIIIIIIVIVGLVLLLRHPAQLPTGSTTNVTSNQPSTPMSQPVTTASGLSYVILTPGTGAMAQSGDTVSVNYIGELENGQKFDASQDHGGPFTFTLGQGQVIPGWDEGVTGMQVGEIRKLTIPANLAYGSTGVSGVIPPNATLIFQVELVSINSTSTTQ